MEYSNRHYTSPEGEKRLILLLDWLKKISAKIKAWWNIQNCYVVQSAAKLFDTIDNTYDFFFFVLIITFYYTMLVSNSIKPEDHDLTHLYIYLYIYYDRVTY